MDPTMMRRWPASRCPGPWSASIHAHTTCRRLLRSPHIRRLYIHDSKSAHAVEPRIEEEPRRDDNDGDHAVSGREGDG
jgi:hypothetical protein